MLQPMGEEAFALISDASRKEGPWTTHTYHLQPKQRAWKGAGQD